MATSPMSEVLQHLRRTALPRQGAGLTDGQLLEDYLRRRDEPALAALVRRHGPMVWGVCRRLLRNHHDAEDAFQATFLVLVRKAASIVPREMVANWLYGVASQTALKARATAAKRGAREKQVTDLPERAVREPDPWRDLQPVLDQELGRLPDKYRAAIVLCDLEGKTRKEAARQLRCPEGTVASRLATARRMLANRLSRHGLDVSGGLLAAALARGEASAGVPNSVMGSTIKAAAAFAAGQAAGVVSAKVAALTEGVLKAMALTKLKVVVVLLAVAALCGAAGLIYQTQATEPPAQGATEKDDKEKQLPPKDGEKTQTDSNNAPQPADPPKRPAGPPVPGAVAFQFDEEVKIYVRSKPVKDGKNDLHIVSVGVGTFKLSPEGHLTATLKAAVVQWVKVDYRISAAVFDTDGKFLGSADHTEHVQYIRLGAVPTMLPDIKLDFGVSEAYKRAAFVVVTISEPKVPNP